MYKLWIVVLCFVCAESGFINVEEDTVVGVLNETDFVDKNATFRGLEKFDENFVSERAGGHEEILLPLLMTAGAKLIGLLPLVLTTLALVAGFSLASSKAALLLGGGLVVYYYLKENKLFLPIAAAKHVSASPDWASFHTDNLLPHDHPDFTRDRIYNTKRIF